MRNNPFKFKSLKLQQQHRQEQKLATELIEALPQAALEGKTLNGDAFLDQPPVKERGGEMPYDDSYSCNVELDSGAKCRSSYQPTMNP